VSSFEHVLVSTGNDLSGDITKVLCFVDRASRFNSCKKQT